MSRSGQGRSCKPNTQPTLAKELGARPSKNYWLFIESAVFDARRAGFGRVVFVIRKDFEELFREKIGARYGVSMQALALQFPLLDPAVASIVFGMRTPGEVGENLAFIRCEIPAKCWRDLATEGIIPERYAHPNRLPQ